MILSIGEILLDIFPEYKRIGGAPFNFAVHIKNFGYPVRFVSRIGQDNEGDEIREYLRIQGFDLNDIQIDGSRPTGRVIVNLDNKGIPEYNILPDVAYDFISYNEDIKSLFNTNVKIIYIGSLIQRTEDGFRTIQDMLERRNKSVKCFYDVNLRPDCFSDDIIKDTIGQADILKLNRDELLYIKNIFDASMNEDEFLQFLLKENSVELISVTMGDKGSSIYTREKEHTLSLQNTQDITDTVGAGDAFASITAIGYLEDWDIDKINTNASEFASIICGIRGAIPKDKKIYEDFKRIHF